MSKKIENKVYSNFGYFIRKIRIEKNLSQAEMAYKLNISQNSYCLIENGQTKITLGHVQNIAEALNIQIDTLVKDIFDIY